MFPLFRSLKTNSFLNAAVRHGPGIPAILLIDGWHIKWLLTLIGFAVLGSIVITAIATAIVQDLSTGLTIGSYAFGAIAVLIAALTFFSAIL